MQFDYITKTTTLRILAFVYYGSIVNNQPKKKSTDPDQPTY